MKAGRSLRAVSVIASLLLWIAAVAGGSSTPRTRSAFEIDVATALVARTICVERATIASRALSLEGRAPHARWSPSALSCAQCAVASHAYARGVLHEHRRAHIARALRRTYDAHAPPRAIDRV